MNIQHANPADKPVSSSSIFKTETANAISLQIKAGELLKEHMTQTPALLLCVFGEVVFENEKSEHFTLKPGDYYQIEPMVKHWVKGVVDSWLVLVK